MGNIKETQVEMFCLNYAPFEIGTGFNRHLNKLTLKERQHKSILSEIQHY